MVSQEQEFVSIPLVRIGAEDVPIYMVNDFVIQHNQNEFILTVGQFQPPILLGTEEERRRQAEQIAYVPIKAVARLGFTRQRLVELIEALQSNLRKYDEKQQGGQDA